MALRLLILSGLRSKPIRFCKLDQIEGDVWTVPAENMKALKGIQILRLNNAGDGFEQNRSQLPNINGY